MVARVRDSVRNSAQDRDEFLRGLSERVGGSSRRRRRRRRKNKNRKDASSSAIRGISARLDMEDEEGDVEGEEEEDGSREGRVRYAAAAGEKRGRRRDSDLQVQSNNLH